MTDESIISILESLNSGKWDHLDITFARIAEDVFYGFYYEKPHPEGYVRLTGEEMYFVRRGGVFAGAVHRLGDHDIHWLVLPDHRGNRLLLPHLVNVIFPHIFKLRPDVDTQRATLALNRQWAEYSRRIAEKVGFEIVEKDEEKIVYELHKKSVKKYPSFRKPNSERPSFLQEIRETELAVRRLNLIADKVDAHYGLDGNRILLENVRRKLRGLQIDLVDLLRWPSHMK